MQATAGDASQGEFHWGLNLKLEPGLTVAGIPMPLNGHVEEREPMESNGLGGTPGTGHSRKHRFEQ